MNESARSSAPHGPRRRPSRRVPRILVALTLITSAACADEPLAAAPPLPEESVPESAPEPTSVVVDGSDFAGTPVSIEPALHRDVSATRTEVRVRRIIYRLVPVVSFALGSGRSELVPPTGELSIDIAGARLRARFVGSGVPVDEGAEVRMRADEHGTYVFDGLGGRPVGTGQLAAWFQSGPGARGVEFKLRTGVPDDPHTIELVCRLFGEWAGASIASVRRSCASMGLPTKFKFGAYRVERTAESVVYLPESALRSDELEPPTGLRHVPEVQFFEPRALERLVPSIDDPPERRVRPDEVLIPVDDGLLVENRTGARVMVTLDGVGLGWVDPSRSMRFTGIPPGGYLVGAMLPLGGVASRARARRLPTHVILER